MKSYVLPAIALGVALPADSSGQARIAPKWLECFAPSECEVAPPDRATIEQHFPHCVESP